ncbi:MAG: energy-coupling factor ABC transporter ATP-binding protein [Synergistaceae bacterium]|jgi:energy-coupling factor transport system ATP-binding protein|nr:energy-coupling factor ABC transporter ATP-binding protein [Synergistaceae bacterium]
MLRFENVCFGYRGEDVMADVSFEMVEGEFTALMGENGAGKSTLCRLGNGLLKPMSGRVMVGGHNTKHVKTSSLAALVGFLFQNPDRQLCSGTVRGEIMLGLENTGFDKATRLKRCDMMLEMFGLDGTRDPFGLSRGERQKVALASVLAPKPGLLILDEPTTGLDYRECVTIMDIISRLNEEGTTILMVSHDMEVVGDFAKRALVLSGGHIVGDGPVREIMRDRAVMESSSLLPAQIPSLAMRIGDLGAAFGSAFTIDDMVAAVERSRDCSGMRRAAAS